MTAQTSFWARRRAGVEAEAEADARAETAAAEAVQAAAVAQKEDAEVLEDLGLPDPAKMQAGDDFAAFMSRDVPKHLQNIALRKLWRSNPVLACVDGLNEYDDDYRAAMLAGGPIKTAYQVGKGMLSHLQEVARQEEAAKAAAKAEAADVAQGAVSQEEADIVDMSLTPEPEPETAAPVAPQDDETSESGPRRMRFRFEEASA